MSRRAEILATLGLVLLAAAVVVRAVFVWGGTPSLLLAVAGGAALVASFFLGERGVRSFLGRRSTREGGSVLGTTGFVVGILVLVNLFGARFHVVRDITADRLFTPAPETVSALRQAPAPVAVWVFHPDGSPAQAALRTVLDGARTAVPSLAVHYVDPDRDPARIRDFELTGYSTVVTVGDRQETFEGSTEEDLVTAIRRASRETRPKVGFLTGHGESYPESPAPEGLEEAGRLLFRRGYDARRMELLRGVVPDTFDVVVIAGPRTSPDEGEIAALTRFLREGGRLLVLLDPASPVELEPLLAAGGLRFVPRFLEDPDLRDPQVIVPAEMSGHPAVAVLRQLRIPVVFPGAGEVRREEILSGVRMAPLFRSGNRTTVVGDTDGAATGRTVAAAVELDVPDSRPGRMIVVGDADFATNASFGTLGNGDFFLGAVRWLGDEEDVVSIRPRERTPRPVIVTRQQGRALLVLFVFLLPVAVLLASGIVWWRRR